MLVALRKGENNIYVVVDSVTREIKEVKKSNKKDNFYYSLLETDTHIVGLDNPEILCMLISIDEDGACIANVSSNKLYITSLDDLQKLIERGVVGNLKHEDGILNIPYYSKKEFKCERAISILKKEHNPVLDTILSENENDDREDDFRDIDNESYLKHRVVRCITFHNRDYDDIKSIDYIKVGNRYRIYHSRVRKNCLEKELLLGNICESNLEYELVRMERKYGR